MEWGHDSCWTRETPFAIPGNSSQLLLMSIAIVTGSAGLIGSETSKKFHRENFHVVGIDNDMRARFFGAAASTAGTRGRLI